MSRSKRSSRRRKQATIGRDEETSSNNNNKIGEEMKKGEGPSVCLFVEHFPDDDDVNSSLYVIRLPFDLPEHDDDEYPMIDSDSDFDITVLPFWERGSFNHRTASVNLGSKIYFFGGNTDYMDKDTPAAKLDTLSRRVQVLDVNNPKQQEKIKMQTVAPMHTPKDRPCVFVADGMIYAFAPHPLDCTTKLPGYKYTGLFERYDPFTDCWQVLPDPPFFHSWAGVQLLDCATVIARSVIIGCPYFHAIFDLDSLTWDNTLLPRPAPHFPFGSVFVSQSASLYHLSGPGVPRLTNPSFAHTPFCELDTAVTRFPFPRLHDTTLHMNFSGKQQIMAQATHLDDNKSFTKRDYFPQRFFSHVGGCFFCYVVTAQLFDQFNQTQYEPCSRAVFIKFFQEVAANYTHNSKSGSSKTVFRPIASFCYKIDTNFPNFDLGTRCSVIGTVPDSWINSPPKKKQESKLNSVNKGMDFITHDLSRVMQYEREKCVLGRHELEKTENGDWGTEELKKLLAAHKAEISLLKAELAMVKAGAGSMSV